MSGGEFRRPAKKYQPRGMRILYEDRDIIAVDKKSGLLTISSADVRDNTAYFLLNNYVRKGNAKSRKRVFVVHRLDRDTSGVIVFAKTEEAKRFLQDNWKDFDKSYLAVVRGRPQEECGTISSYLAENRAFRMYSVDNPGLGKFARTGYKVVRSRGDRSLLEIALYTGRKNQIRVHMADLGCPVVGDNKYGVKESGIKRLALHAASLTIIHPYNKKRLRFEAEMPPYFKTLLKK